MKLNEFGTNDVRGVNNYGSAALQRRQNQKAGNVDANLTTKETLGKNIFVDKFIQKASAGLANALKSGAISATTPVQPTTPTSPTSPSPEEIRKQKQAAAISAINAKPVSNQPTQATQFTKPSGTAMPTQPYQVPGLGTNPNQPKSIPAQTKPSGFKATPGPNAEDYARFEKLKQAALKTQTEGKFQKLNRVFESILNEQTPTISSFVLDAWKAFLHGVNLSNPQLMTKAQELANQVQATYSKDKGMAALKQLADLAWYASSASAVATGQNKVNDDDDDYGSSAQSYSSNIQGSGNMRQAYGQINRILSTLGKNERAELITALQNAEEKSKI